MRIANLLPLRDLTLLAALAVIPQACFAQVYRDPPPRRPYCDEIPRPYPPLRSCEGPGPCRSAPPCEQAPPAQPREAPSPTPPPTPRPAPAPQPSLQETGYYQAGPRSGVGAGASGTFGFRGGALTLPRVRLELPSFELPSLYRVSHGASMHFRESIAPWVSTGFQRTASGAVAPQARSAEPAPSEREAAQPRSAADKECEALKAKYEEKIEELNRKIRECEQMRKSIEQSLCERPAIAPHGRPPQQGAQCVPPGPQCVPPGTQGQRLPAGRNQQQPFPLPAPAPAHVAPQPQPQPQAQTPRADRVAHPIGGPSDAAVQNAALLAGERASLRPSADLMPRAPQPIPRRISPPGPQEAIHQARPSVVPVSHLGAPRSHSYPNLQPLPNF